MRAFGYKPDVPDARDFRFSAHRAALEPVPEVSDVDMWDVPAKNQLGTSSCVGNAGAGGLRRAFYYAGIECPELAARMGYRGALNVDGSNADEGTYLRSFARFAMEYGCCAESVMPFSEARILDPIDFAAERDAFDRRRLGSYHRIAAGDVDGVCRALGAGMPVIAGWSVSEAFASSLGLEVFTAQAGQPIAGGHAMVLVGHGSSAYYTERIATFRPRRTYTRLFRILGSWGPHVPTELSYGYNGRIAADDAFVAEATDLWALDVREVVV